MNFLEYFQWTKVLYAYIRRLNELIEYEELSHNLLPSFIFLEVSLCRHFFLYPSRVPSFVLFRLLCCCFSYHSLHLSAFFMHFVNEAAFLLLTMLLRFTLSTYSLFSLLRIPFFRHNPHHFIYFVHPSFLFLLRFINTLFSSFAHSLSSLLVSSLSSRPLFATERLNTSASSLSLH